jgi:hypothetical protein
MKSVSTHQQIDHPVSFVSKQRSKERPQSYLVTLRSSNRVSGTVSAATFNMALPFSLDKDTCYMMRAVQFAIHDAAGANMQGVVFSVGIDQYFSNVYDSQHGSRPCGTLLFSPGYYYTAPAIDTGAVLNVPAWSNGQITVQVSTALDGNLAVALDQPACGWVLVLEVFPSTQPLFSGKS